MDERLVSMYRRFTWRILSQLRDPVGVRAAQERDHRLRAAGGERIAAEYGEPVTTVIYPDGVHILNNLWYQVRPLVADWLAETL